MSLHRRRILSEPSATRDGHGWAFLYRLWPAVSTFAFSVACSRCHFDYPSYFDILTNCLPLHRKSALLFSHTYKPLFLQPFCFDIDNESAGWHPWSCCSSRSKCLQPNSFQNVLWYFRTRNAGPGFSPDAAQRQVWRPELDVLTFVRS